MFEQSLTKSLLPLRTERTLLQLSEGISIFDIAHIVVISQRSFKSVSFQGKRTHIDCIPDASTKRTNGFQPPASEGCIGGTMRGEACMLGRKAMGRSGRLKPNQMEMVWCDHECPPERSASPFYDWVCVCLEPDLKCEDRIIPHGVSDVDKKLEEQGSAQTSECVCVCVCVCVCSLTFL